MEPDTFSSLPFLTRDMLAFKHGLALKLRVSTRSTVATKLKIRGFTREGFFTFSHTPTSDSVVKDETFNIPDFPIWASITDEQGGYVQGSCYASLSLLLNDDKLFELCHGLVYRAKSVSFPNTFSTDIRPAGGNIKKFTGTNPTANAELSDSVTSGQAWRLMSVRFTLVTDATVVNRRVHFTVSTGGVVVLDAFSEVEQTASQTINYTCAPFGALPDSADDNDILIPIPPDLIVTGGIVLGTSTTGRVAGDDFSAPSFFVEQWFEGF